MQDLKKIEKIFLEELSKTKNEKEVEELRVKYLGRKGVVTELLKELGSIDISKRKKAGAELNSLKNEIAEELKNKGKEAQKAKISEIEKQELDITAPGSAFPKGHLHPVTLVYHEIISIFSKLGFSVAEGPEVDTDWYSFEALNIPKNHPARDFADTFYVSEEVNLRPHTSNVQIHFMENSKPPIRIIAPGRVYRRDSDVTHTPMFHQLEGLLVDKDVSFADLKGTLEYFIREFYGPERKIRFRPHHFPFTEPSAEVDISCGICHGKGCRSCKYTGWLEILGAGMVHPNVLKNCGIDPNEYKGFAFGLGIERIAMLKYNIDDLRLFYDGDLRFNNQF